MFLLYAKWTDGKTEINSWLRHLVLAKSLSCRDFQSPL